MTSRHVKPARRNVKRYQRTEAITPIEHGGLQAAYDHFNAALFGGSLPDVSSPCNAAPIRGTSSLHRIAARSGEFGRHELALNPDAFYITPWYLELG